jgi:hypothetical protein
MEDVAAIAKRNATRRNQLVIPFKGIGRRIVKIGMSQTLSLRPKNRVSVGKRETVQRANRMSGKNLSQAGGRSRRHEDTLRRRQGFFGHFHSTERRHMLVDHY